MATQPLWRATRTIADWLPRGRTLPDASWRTRHQAVVVLLQLHAVAIGLVSLLRGDGGFAALGSAAVPALGAFAASRAVLSRPVRSAIGAISLMLTSAVVVHLMAGSIEGHFHFFAMIPVVALYEDWMPFSLAVGVVLLHHGVMGTLDPRAVYDHADAWQHPWRWAFIHAAFFAAACVGSVINWKLHERARDVEQDLAARMRHQAHHDALTGLPNRTQLREHAQAVLAQATRRGAPVSVLLIDLDRFKEINDVLGHASGDVLLARLGPLMATAVREGDILARLGGDEFAAVLANADEAAAIRVARRLTALLTETVDIDGISIQVDGSVGIAVRQSGGTEDVDTLLRQADVAMYTAKRGRCGYTIYRNELDTTTRERLSILGELRHALANDEIVLHFQPKLSLTTGELVGVEALARWNHPIRGLLPPGEFIPAAESTGLIIPLTLRALELALAQARAWQSAGRAMPIAVNLSPRCLAEPALPGQVLAMLERYDVPAQLLELEITENTLASDPDRALSTLLTLHAAGIRISIDDFGTGYSSMSYLRRLPVSELKVDRSFVAGMLSNPEDAVLVRSLVDLGHNLGLTVVAEGVEDEATLRALAGVDCDVVQGFHLGRPMSPLAFEEWAARTHPDIPQQRRADDAMRQAAS
jgi:diguanylate cyclase (GGDEF)-like protein